MPNADRCFGKVVTTSLQTVNQMPPMGPQLEWQKNILTLLALLKDFDLLPSGLQTCHAFSAYVMLLIPRANDRCLMRNKMAPSGVRSISVAQLKGVEWPCGAGGSHGAGRLTLRALFLLSC